MTDPTWRFVYFGIERTKWLANFQPTFNEAARLLSWKEVIETQGFPPGTVIWEDENFVARVPETRVVVAGVAVPYEGLLIVKTIVTLGVVA